MPHPLVLCLGPFLFFFPISSLFDVRLFPLYRVGTRSVFPCRSRGVGRFHGVVKIFSLLPSLFFLRKKKAEKKMRTGASATSRLKENEEEKSNRQVTARWLDPVERIKQFPPKGSVADVGVSKRPDVGRASRTRARRQGPVWVGWLDG